MGRKRDQARGDAGEAAIRRQVEARVGRIPEPGWRFLEQCGYVQTAVDEEIIEPGAGVEYLAEIAGPFQDFLRGWVQSEGASPRRERKLSAAERLIAAVRRMQAHAAAHLPEVQACRQKWLPGGVVRPDQVGEVLRPQRQVWEWTLRAEGAVGEPMPETPPKGARLVRASSSDEPEATFKALSDELARRFGWSPFAARFWLLTGILPDQPPILVRPRVMLPMEGIPPFAFLELTVPLFLTPAQVARRLREIRKDARGARLRSLSRTTAALLEHVAVHGDGKDSWQEWRRRHGGYPMFKRWRQAIKRAYNVLHKALHAGIEFSSPPSAS